MEVTAFYIDERNAITQPERMVFVSQYFRRNWMATLGPTGVAIVIFLRGQCYHNRRSGETRDTVQVPQRQIALGCGCSVATVKRELEGNAALKRFVEVSHEWERDGATGRVRQLENVYKIAMDDPLTEADEARLRDMVARRIEEEKQKRPEETGGRRKRIRQAGGNSESMRTESASTELNTECSNAVRTAFQEERTATSGVMPEPVAQIELLRPVAQFEPTSLQIELPLKESLLKTTKEQTLNVQEEETKFLILGESETQAPERAGHSNRLAVPQPDDYLAREVTALVEELHDWGSERRHRQLLSLCEQHGLNGLVQQALTATRKRQARESRSGLLEKPGAYYQATLIKLLEGKQVFVPKASDGDDPDEVRRLARQSLLLPE